MTVFPVRELTLRTWSQVDTKNEGRYAIMKIIRNIGYASLASIAIGAFTPSLSIADTEQANVSASNSVVHRVSHTLATAQNYTESGYSGYKWGKKVEASDTGVKWAESTSARSGYKWGSSTTSAVNEKPYSQPTTSYSEQAANRWSRRNFSEQAANRWSRR